MLKRRFAQVLTTAGVALMLTATVKGDTIISYTTNLPGTEFVGGVNSLTLNSSGGQAATLTFIPNSMSGAGVPSNIDLGDFLLSCATCTTAQTTLFGSFTFDLVVDDATDNATGVFVGTSAGGTVSSNSSTISISWLSPVGLQLGPGTNHALTGNFGPTQFLLGSPTTLIVAPNSGTPPGDTTVQGQIISNTAPEPATLPLIGGGLIVLGLAGRKKLVRS
jgi:hypothetical protein